jgi:hypothetical protein
MEPILELATRITTQLWFLHDLFSKATEFGTLSSDDWLKRAAPDDYSSLRNLFDLTGQKQAWTSDEWDVRFDFNFPKDFADLTAQLLAESAREHAEKSDQRRRHPKLSTREENYNALRAAGLNALQKFLDRIDVFKKYNYLGTTGAPPGWLMPDITRERVFEKVADRLFEPDVAPQVSTANLDMRVELAKTFLPSHEIGNGFKIHNEFFVEEQIRQRISETKKTAYPADIWLNPDPTAKLKILLDPPTFHKLCCDLSLPVPFSMVLRDELDEIGRSRLLRFGDSLAVKNMAAHTMRASAGISSPHELVEEQAFCSNLFGVGLSGGGIRSATFALGLMQGMADRNILPYVDILSTVSGGGYIGSWLISWIKRRGGVRSVQGSMQGSAASLQERYCLNPGSAKEENVPKPDQFNLVTRNTDPEADHVRPMQLLRFYSRYLAPQAGLFAADTWTIAATWARNTLLNLLILMTFLGAVLLLPRIATFVLLHFPLITASAFAFLRTILAPTGLIPFLARHVPHLKEWKDFSITLAIGALLLWFGCYRIGKYNLATFGPHKDRRRAPTQGFNDVGVVNRIVPFVMAGGFAEIALLWYAPAGQEIIAGCWTSLVLLGGVLILWKYSHSWKQSISGLANWGNHFHTILALVGSVGAGGLLLYWLNSILQHFGTDTERGVWVAASAGIGLALAAIVSVVVLFIGLLGTNLEDDQREWWSRLGAWLAIVTSVWLGICAISFFMPFFIAKLGLEASAAGVGWAAITGWGTKLAYSPKSERNGGDDLPWYNAAIMKLAPATFVFGILSAVSFGVFLLVDWLIYKCHWLTFGPVAKELCCYPATFSLDRLISYYWPLLYPGSLAPAILIVVLMAASAALAYGVDVNQFSMHNFYKNRLVRCYLGASRIRRHRSPNAFTSFDSEDDIRLCRFQTADPSQPLDMSIDCLPSYAGPFPIVNTTLNVTQGEDLGLQERKGESFVFTPLWSGFDYSRRQASVKKTVLGQYGFRRTEEFAEPQERGALLGTAMAISGAAFNSNAGFHTWPTLAFLLTIFGVRLGWWAGNPRGNDWTSPSPLFGLIYLTKELTANTSTDSSFVLLSDGGHFENMGLYELIRRRCRYIILSDAEEDQKFKLEGIGGAVRKCRVDFGVVIDLDLEALKPLGDPTVSRLHYTVGSILYPEGKCGKLVYIKASVTGDEPVDLVEFAKRHPEFPHTSTVDQFFDESHFESYRALGQHVAESIFFHDLEPLHNVEPLPVGAAGAVASHINLRVSTLFEKIETEWKAKIKSIEKKESDDKKGTEK